MAQKLKLSLPHVCGRGGNLGLLGSRFIDIFIGLKDLKYVEEQNNGPPVLHEIVGRVYKM